MPRIINSQLDDLSLGSQHSRLKELRSRSPRFRARARFIETGRVILYFLFLFFVGQAIIDHLKWFWAVAWIAMGLMLIDWLVRRLILLPIAEKEIQRLAEQDVTPSA